MNENQLVEQLFDASEWVRYVAFYDGKSLVMRSRDDLSDASSSESDRYEELLVNPALITLARQRGDIDCGGFQYLAIRYGNFHQLVYPLPRGHVSVALEPAADVSELAPVFGQTIERLSGVA